MFVCLRRQSLALIVLLSVCLSALFSAHQQAPTHALSHALQALTDAQLTNAYAASTDEQRSHTACSWCLAHAASLGLNSPATTITLSSTAYVPPLAELCAPRLSQLFSAYTARAPPARLNT